MASSGRAAPPPPPETFGAYSKKGQESSGVIAMIDLLIADLDKEMQQAEAGVGRVSRGTDTSLAQASRASQLRGLRHSVPAHTFYDDLQAHLHVVVSRGKQKKSSTREGADGMRRLGAMFSNEPQRCSMAP